MKTIAIRTCKIACCILACVVLQFCTRLDVSNDSELDAAIQDEMQKRRIPALTACIIKNADIVWMKSYGRADKLNQIPAASHTIFLLASMSKTVVATAVLQLAERGLIDIDQDISQYLPFPLRNPTHPLAMITPRMLLTHSSGLAGPKTDDELPNFYDWFPTDGAPPWPRPSRTICFPGERDTFRPFGRRALPAQPNCIRTWVSLCWPSWWSTSAARSSAPIAATISSCRWACRKPATGWLICLPRIWPRGTWNTAGPSPITRAGIFRPDR